MTKHTSLKVAGLALLGMAIASSYSPVSHAQTAAPKYELDRSWPKSWPDRWIFGGLAGVCMDAKDHLLVLNRQEEVADASLNSGHRAPGIIEFDAEGNVVHSWGDPNLLDPRLHSCFFDPDNNVWIASAPSGMIQKYTHDGSKLLMTIGKKGVFDSSDGTVKGKALNSNASRFFGPSSIYVDPKNGDIYLADGESGGWNHRVIVMDKEGSFLRQWQPEGMETVHCLVVTNDELVYVCNRTGDKIQIYDKQGKFIKTYDVPWTPYTPSPDGKRRPGGAAVALALSPDAKQSLLFLVNQALNEVEVIDRQTGKILTHFGEGVGHFPGQLTQPHAIAVDSKGNVYVAENNGVRIQKFKPVGR